MITWRKFKKKNLEKIIHRVGGFGEYPNMSEPFLVFAHWEDSPHTTFTDVAHIHRLILWDTKDSKVSYETTLSSHMGNHVITHYSKINQPINKKQK